MININFFSFLLINFIFIFTLLISYKDFFFYFILLFIVQEFLVLIWILGFSINLLSIDIFFYLLVGFFVLSISLGFEIMINVEIFDLFFSFILLEVLLLCF